MKKMFFTMLIATFSFIATDAMAQALARNPWAVPVQTDASSVTETTNADGTVKTQPQVVYVRIDQGSQPIQGVYEGGADNVWNTQMPEFTGRLTTWGYPGEVANLPEVNMHNILSITQHLRNMGYDIPDSLEEKIKAAPAATKQRVMQSLSDVRRAKDPMSKSAQAAMDIFENETGLNIDNLLGNSLDLLSKK